MKHEQGGSGMIKPADATRVLERVQASELNGKPLRKLAMMALSELDGYDWSGVYRLEGDALVLDEYVGAATDHTRIPVGRGVCGTAVAENANQIVDDVRTLTNYLACSTQTRSEIVVLIRDPDGLAIGQIDVDGHRVGAFDASDERFLEKLAGVLAARW